MRIFSRLRGRCYCAFCKAERKIYVKKHVDLTNVVGAMALAFAMAFALYGEADPRALFFFVVLLVGAEIFVYGRWRASMECKLCGFDPLLYKRSPAEAALRVREFYNEKMGSPRFYLTRSPLLQKQKEFLASERRKRSYQGLEGKLLGKKSSSTSLAPSNPL